MQTLADLLKEPGSRRECDYRIKHKDGRWQYAHAAATNLLDYPPLSAIVLCASNMTDYREAETELEGYRKRLEELVEERTQALIEANDKLQAEITEHKLAEDRLLSSNSELDSFAYMVSHDLRGSLSVIKGFAHSALRARQDERLDDEINCLSEIIEGTTRMNKFIQSLLTYCEAARTQETKTRVESGRVLEEVLNAYREQIRKSATDMKIQEGLPAIEVESVRLYQVLANLLENAIKYNAGNPDPRIEIGGKEESGEGIFFIKDNGSGMQGEDLQKIFEPFTRCVGAGQPGLGIGLATVKRAVDGWGGKVWVESQPGSGSTFFFTAPIANT
ncbi:MAG: hypothetical protein A2V52_04005 [Actinobacteria bacterium RBG_19FT_COMBO_54_7]|nr:MAG: hypothetical protein A2V52_04005 [Actinobacteria bacterium RBG_19FT_COMBO_54_7]